MDSLPVEYLVPARPVQMELLFRSFSRHSCYLEAAT